MEKAEQRAKAFRNISFYAGIIACIFILAVKNAFIGFYNVPEETKILAGQIMTVFAFITICCSVNMTLIMGVLRGAGDTKFCMGIEIGCLWCLAIPLALVMAFVFKAPVSIVFLFMKTDEITKAGVSLIRMRGNKWLNSLTRDFETE